MNNQWLKMIGVGVMASAFCTASLADGQITVENVGLATPESVEYYAAEDIYLVTNVNGSPFAADDNGFISKISPSGEVLDLKWIDGSKPDIQLDAPKGAAINGNILYIADLTHVRIFSLPSGKQLGSVNIKDTLFLNGITPGEGKSVYVTDSGFIPGFKEGGSDAVYQVFPDGSFKTIIKSTTLKTPNGIFQQGDDLMIGSARSSQIFRLERNGELSTIATASGMDGLLVLPDGSYLFSSWKDKAVYRQVGNAKSQIIAQPLVSPADIGYDTKRHRVLVPIFLENKVVIQPL
jgi:hypothetical protein